MKKLIATAALTSIAATSVWAESGYIGAELSSVNAEITADYFSGSFDAQPLAFRVKGGGEIYENLVVEGYIGMGIGDDTVEDTDIDLEVDSMIGVNLKGLIPLGDTAAFYGKVGFARITFEDSDKDTYDENGLTYGIGAQFSVSETLAFTLDYSVFPDAENKEYELDVESDMISIGFQYYP